MRAVILAGGRGTRLAPYTIAFPKPLVPVGELPIIEIVLRQLAWHGINQVVISVGYLAELIQAYFVTRGGVAGLEIAYLREPHPLGTAGAIGYLAPVDEDLLVVNGDVLTTLNFAEMIKFHRERNPALTIAVYPRTVKIDLGVLDLDSQGFVTDYLEKPSLSYQCSMGIYIYSPRAVAAIEPGERLDFPDLVLRLLHRGEQILAYQADCYWLDIGRREDYERALAEFPERRHEFLPDESISPPTESPITS